MKSDKYYVITKRWYGLKVVKAFGNLLEAKRFVASLSDNNHYKVVNSNIVLFAI